MGTIMMALHIAEVSAMTRLPCCRTQGWPVGSILRAGDSTGGVPHRVHFGPDYHACSNDCAEHSSLFVPPANCGIDQVPDCRLRGFRDLRWMQPALQTSVGYTHCLGAFCVASAVRQLPVVAATKRLACGHPSSYWTHGTRCCQCHLARPTVYVNELVSCRRSVMGECTCTGVMHTVCAPP